MGLCIFWTWQSKPWEITCVILTFSEHCWQHQIAPFGEQAECTVCPLSSSKALLKHHLSVPRWRLAVKLMEDRFGSDSSAICYCAYIVYLLPAPYKQFPDRAWSCESSWYFETREFCGENERASGAAFWQKAGPCGSAGEKLLHNELPLLELGRRKASREPNKNIQFTAFIDKPDSVWTLKL